MNKTMSLEDKLANLELYACALCKINTDSLSIQTIKSYAKDIKTALKEKEKQDKLLRIVKKKVLPHICLEQADNEYFVTDAEGYGHTKLIKQEYDLLKEVLKDESR